MGFFDNLGETLQKKTSEATSKAKEMLEINNLKSEIAKVDKSIKEKYCNIGKAQYIYMSKGIPAEFNEDKRAIDQLLLEREELSRKMELIKNSGSGAEEDSEDGGIFCANCGAEITGGAAFCPSCGTKVEN